jgi:hypothetical protein
MKKSELRQLIREELSNLLTEEKDWIKVPNTRFKLKNGNRVEFGWGGEAEVWQSKTDNLYYESPNTVLIKGFLITPDDMINATILWDKKRKKVLDVESWNGETLKNEFRKKHIGYMKKYYKWKGGYKRGYPEKYQ